MENFTIQPDNVTLAPRNACLLNVTTAPDHFEIADVNQPSWIYLYIIPILSSLGLAGNGLSSIVMIQLSRDSSFYVYLAVLALADCGVAVFGGLLRWMDITGLVQLSGSVSQSYCVPAFLCNIIVGQVSAWVTVAVSVDRYIAVCHPFKVATYCTKKRAIITITCIVVAIVALNFPLFFYEWNDDYTSCLEYYHLTDLPTYSLVPLFLNFVFSLLIVRCLVITSKQRRELSNITSSVRKTIIMLLAVVCTFCILSLPLICVFVYALATNKDQDEFVKTNTILVHVLETLYLLNHTVNFFMYGLSGTVFRGEFTRLFCRCRK